MDTVLEGAGASFAPVASHISGGSRPDFYRMVLPPYPMIQEFYQKTRWTHDLYQETR